MKSRLSICLGTAFVVSATAFTPALAQSNAELKTQVANLTARLDALERGGGRKGVSVGSWPGGITFYGYVRGDFIEDIDANLGTTTGGIASLGAPGGTALTGTNTFQAHARQSRLGVRGNSATDMGDLKFVLEGDFFGAGNTTFRLRHAYGSLGNFTAGQTWTNFMPLHSLHNTVDFNGTAGAAFARQTQLRYAFNLSQDLSATVSLENALQTSNDPVVTAALQYKTDRFTISGHGLVGTVNTIGGADDDAWGAILAASFNLWQGGKLQATYAQGSGISSYLTSSGGLNTVGASAVDVDAFTVGLSQEINKKWSTGVYFGRVEHDPVAGILPTDNRKVETIHANLFYRPVDNVTVGLEYFTGERTDFSGAQFDADRVQAMVQFNF